MPHDCRCIGVFGRTGSGKSTYAKRLVSDPARKAVIVFDPMDEYLAARDTHRSLESLRQAIAVRWRDGFKLSYVPERDPITELHRLSDLIWQLQSPFQTGKLYRPITLVVEEANLSYPVQGLPANLRMIEKLTLQGRHRGINLVMVSQRPSMVSMNFRSQIQQWVVFPLSSDGNRKAVTDEIGGEVSKSQIAKLKDHEYLTWTKGLVHYGNNF